MTTVIQRYPTDYAVTPGFFTSCLQDSNADGVDMFDGAFTTGLKQIELTQGDHQPDNNHNRQDFLHGVEDPSSVDLNYPPMGRPFSNEEDLLASGMTWNGLKQEVLSQPSYSPLLPSQVLSPPDSAVDPPPSYGFVQYSGGMRSPLHDILTQNHSAYARAQHGQITPPDDRASPPSILHEPRKGDSGTSATLGESIGSRKRKHNTAGPDFSTPSPSKRSRRGREQSKLSVGEMSPIDPDNPEDVKRSKFLERNRVAASKCRQKKKEWTANLEARARDLQNCRNQLGVVVDSLKEEVLFLKGELLQHTNCGCTRIREYLSQEVNSMTSPHDTPSVTKRLEANIESRPSSQSGSRRSSAGTDVSAVPAEVPTPSLVPTESDMALEGLLASHLEHDTSDEGIASQVRRH